ncbi:Uncharacterised protein [Sphingobacterium spiritivorum]|uniref:Uncharacterized protein n=1 Tax=Sphingobacterium spiritivorum TaxID=258 RepID=A0A380CEH5_SPHSI|nr:hypothetical protein [Sphingobacterium spiritivorum]SUJ19163.1 Uncharacterised protein [Sphingobacterium spiritivorum]
MNNNSNNLLNGNSEDSQTIINHQKGYVAFPYEGEHFKDFISGLLGTPQTITKYIDGVYDLSLSDIQDIDHLLNQRLTQQNNGKLLQLKIELFFNDDSSVSLNSLTELATYNEIKPIVSNKIKLTWSYLIQFSDKQYPEKQQIEIMFSSRDLELEEGVIFTLFPRRIAGFLIRIEHTARTWGTDIEHILSSKIESLRIKPTSGKLFAQKNANIISLFFAFTVLSMSAYFVLVKTLKWNKESTIKTEQFLKSTSSIDKKLDYVVGLISQNRLFEANSLVSFYYILFFIISIIISIYLRAILKNVKPSFITLTKESVKYRERMLEKYKKKTARFWWSILIAIFVNIVSTLLFEKFLK